MTVMKTVMMIAAMIMNVKMSVTGRESWFIFMLNLPSGLKWVKLGQCEIPLKYIICIKYEL